jgi:protein involved in polysaccharide export with SLBB domain
MSRSHLPAAVRALALAIVTIPLLAGCRAPEEKRVFQYLNTQGFGQMATGDANVENYLVVGDSVTIRDSIHTELQLPPQDVDVDGTINLPDLGQLTVKGKTRRQLEALLTELYAPLYERTDIKVVIHPATALTGGGKKYFVIGEVKKHGKQTFVGDRTIFEAVYDADPNDQTANLGRVQLIRGDPVDPLIIWVNMHDIIDYGDTTYNVIVHENDIIYVPPTLFGTIGNLVKQLIYPLQVIAQSLQGFFFWTSYFTGPNKVF